MSNMGVMGPAPVVTVQMRLTTFVTRLAEAFVFVALPLLFMSVKLGASWQDGNLAIDLRQTLLPAAERLADLDSPYPAYGYPPLVAFLLVPFSFVPYAHVLIVGLLIASVPAILWLVGVRDWRCYGLAFLWTPVFSAVQTANVTLPMMLCLALAWRHRDRAGIAGVSTGVAVAAKILAWPAGLWLLASRRWRTLAVAITAGGLLSFGLWAVLGFDGLFDYPSSLDTLGGRMAPQSYTFGILLEDLGATAPVGRAVTILVALAILLGIVVAARRGADDVSFALVAAACIFASPITWMHSFAFLLLAVAVRRPRLGPAWLLPLPMLVGSGTGNGETWEAATTLVLALATVVAVVLPERKGHSLRPAIRPL